MAPAAIRRRLAKGSIDAALYNFSQTPQVIGQLPQITVSVVAADSASATASKPARGVVRTWRLIAPQGTVPAASFLVSELVWDQRDASGVQVPPGHYEFTLESADGRPIPTSAPDTQTTLDFLIGTA